MLSAALSQYQQQQRISALALASARRLALRGSAAVAQALGPYQAAAVALALQSTPAVLAEQGISAPSVASVVGSSLLTGAGASALIDQAQTAVAFDRLVLTLVADAGRTAAAVDIATRPVLTSYVRSLNPPSCGRCAVLAGRVYIFTKAFERHPQCDCLMTPTTQAAGMDLVTDPVQAFQDGQVSGLSSGDVEALNQGANIYQVINVRRKAAGLVKGSSVLKRGGRLTPQGVMAVSSDRDTILKLLRRYGYIT